MVTKTAAPFLKWAGGKRQLLPALSEILPRKMRTYYEPFLGGGAVFFHLAAEGRFERAVLNDWNRELVDCYRVIRDFPDDLIRKLLDHMNHEWNTASYFDSMRSQQTNTLDPADRAARLIYLNRTCFNGLYRVNKRGQFNVPFGKYKNPALFNEQNLRACSQVLNRFASLHTGDFVDAVENAQEGDVVYFDPPYVPLSVSSNFANYTSDGFSINDHHRLAALFRELKEKGVAVVLSNSDTQVVRALFQGFEIHPVQAKRNINSKVEGRGFVGELIIVSRHEAIVLDAEPTPLDTIPVPVEVHCSTCGEIFSIELSICPQCGTAVSEAVEGSDDAEVHTVP